MDDAPDNPETLFAGASQLHAAGRLEEAKAVLQKLLALQANHPPGLNLMGICLGQQGDLSAGCRFVEQAIASGGDQPIYLRNLCELRRQNDDPFNAIRAGRRAIDLAPEDRIARLNLAMAEQDALELDAARANTEIVLEAEPDNGSAHFLRAQLHLLNGDFLPGWNDYAWRWHIPGAEKPKPAIETKTWDGAPVEGALLLISDQGFGDIMQFARYLPWARSRCQTLVVGIVRELKSLLQRLVPDARFITDVGHAGEAAAYATFSDLPGLAATTIDTIPLPDRYLTADPAKHARWQARLDQLAPPPNRRIGIAWAGRREHRADRMRSMPLSTFAPFFAREGLTFVSVQKGEPVAQIGSYFGPAPLVNLGPELEDFDDTAAVLSALDMLITVDTSVAHLAGALAVPTHVLLPFRPDWRWMLDRTDTPWYQSLTLWRDKGPGGRAETIERLSQALLF